MIKISIGTAAHRTRVEIDGVEVRGLIGLKVEASIGARTEVQLVLSDTVEIEGVPGVIELFQHGSVVAVKRG